MQYVKSFRGLAVKVSKVRYMELIKLCVQNKQGLLFSFFSLLINIVCQKCVFKASERLLFSLLIINQYCTPNVCYTTKNLFKTCARNQVKTFNFSNTKNTCSKRAVGWFSVY